MSNVLVCGGGSGGHVYPALAMLEAFQAHPNVQRIGFISTPGPLERRVFAAHRDISFFPIHARHFRGTWKQNLGALGALGRGLLESFGAIKRFRPSIIIGTGGYSSFPALLLGLKLGIPTAILEPNLKPGLVNRWLAPRVDRVFYNHDHTFAAHRAQQTGIPLRPQLFETKRTNALYRRWGLDPAKQTLLILGGSLGANALNTLTLKLAAQLPGLQMILSSGVQQLETFPDLRRAAAQLPNLRVFPYIERMDEAFALTDVALCRGGALTLAELNVCGIPAVVVPWEGAAEAHQLHNAQAHVDQGAGVLIRECDLSVTNVLEALKRMLVPQQLKSMQRAGLTLGKRHRQASARILKEVEPYLNGKVSLHRHRRRRDERFGESILATAAPLAGLEYRSQFPYC